MSHKRLPRTIALTCLFVSTSMCSEPALTIGLPTYVYRAYEQNGANPQLSTKTTVCQLPFDPPYHTPPYNPNWRFILDAPLCPLKVNGSTISFFLSQAYGMDKYRGTLADPLNTREWGIYRDSVAASAPGRHARFDALVLDEWDPASELTYTDSLYKGEAASPPLPPGTKKIPIVTWNKYLWVVCLYKLKARDVAGISGLHEGDLLGITHAEATPLGYPPMYNYKYSLGISYSRVSQNGKRWKYYGDIVKQQADQFADVYLPKGNGYLTPGFRVHNIDGGPSLVKNDSFYVYFTEYAHQPSGLLEARVGVASARVSDVLKAIATMSPGRLPNNIWRKFRNGTWAESALTGVGDNVVPLPETVPKYNENTGYVGFCTHNSATDCQALGNHLYLMTLSVSYWTPTSFSNPLQLFTSTDGLNWHTPKTIYSPPSNSFSQYASFVSLNSDASDDCRIVGREFCIVYPRLTASDTYGADLLLSRIAVTSNSMPVPGGVKR